MDRSLSIFVPRGPHARCPGKAVTTQALVSAAGSEPVTSPALVGTQLKVYAIKLSRIAGPSHPKLKTETVLPAVVELGNYKFKEV